MTQPTFRLPAGTTPWRRRLKGLWLPFASLVVGLPLVVGAVASHVGHQQLSRPRKVTPALSSLFDAGFSHYRAGRTAAALICWRQALVLSPYDATVHNNIGSALMRLGQPSEARISFQNAIALDPNRELFVKNLDWANRELAAPGEGQAATSTTPTVGETGSYLGNH